MRVALVCLRDHEGQSEGPEEKASRYTGRPGTLGSTLVYDSCFLTFKVELYTASIYREDINYYRQALT